jgi:hypothetical protein
MAKWAGPRVAPVDRLLRHCHMTNIRGRAYQLRDLEKLLKWNELAALQSRTPLQGPKLRGWLAQRSRPALVALCDPKRFSRLFSRVSAVGHKVR